MHVEHALALCLYGVLLPGDELLSVTGKPYDTLDEVIGIRGESGTGSLRTMGLHIGKSNSLKMARWILMV